MADKPRLSLGVEARKALPVLPERRYLPAQYEVRSLAGTTVELSGYASTYEQPYGMFDAFGPYEEVARAGMCAKTLSEGADVAYLGNHTGLTLARTTNGKLRLSEDSRGLHSVAELDTQRSDARDLVLAIERGDVDQMSFGFRVVRQEWSPDFAQRDLVEVDLNRGDVSAVNYGANPYTSVSSTFRAARPAHLHRMAAELRAGKALSAATMTTLSQVLDLIATADNAVDEAQPLLADLMGVPNPDADDDGPGEKDSAEQDAQRSAVALLELEREREHERRRRSLHLL